MFSTPDDCNLTSVTLNAISSLETKLLACFDKVQNELLNLKNIIIKNLEMKRNERWRKRVSFLDKKVISLESRHMLEQYGRINEVTCIPWGNRYPWFCASKGLKNKVVDILSGVNVSNDEF